MDICGINSALQYSRPLIEIGRQLFTCEDVREMDGIYGVRNILGGR
jgi:hypothetical protein